MNYFVTFFETHKIISNYKLFLELAAPTTIIVLGILSYLQARKTIFLPLKTETFKLQLKLFEDILFFFDKHKNLTFIRSFDYEEIFKLNYFIVLNIYFERVLGIDIDKNKFHETIKKFPFTNVAPKHVNRFSKTGDKIIFNAYSNNSISSSESWSNF